MAPPSGRARPRLRAPDERSAGAAYVPGATRTRADRDVVVPCVDVERAGCARPGSGRPCLGLAVDDLPHRLVAVQAAQAFERVVGEHERVAHAVGVPVTAAQVRPAPRPSTGSMTYAVTPGMSPSSSTTASQSPAAASPASSDDAQPVPYAAFADDARPGSEAMASRRLRRARERPDRAGTPPSATTCARSVPGPSGSVCFGRPRRADAPHRARCPLPSRREG